MYRTRRDERPHFRFLCQIRVLFAAPVKIHPNKGIVREGCNHAGHPPMPTMQDSVGGRAYAFAVDLRE